MEPWIKLYRKFKEWEWYGDVIVTAVFIHLLISANWKPKKWQGLTIDTGELITSIATLSKELNISVRQTRTALDKLQACHAIDKQTTNKYTLIKVLNYSKYQSTEDFGDKHIDNQATNERQTNDKQTTTTKELKNNRNIDIYNYIYYSEDFKEVVNAYENNIGVISPAVADILKDFVTDFGKELIVFAIEEAVKSNVRNIRYIEGILRTWKEKGVSSVEGARLATAEHRTKLAAMPKPGVGRAEPKKNFFQDYDNDISEFELEMMRQRMNREETEEERAMLKEFEENHGL